MLKRITRQNKFLSRLRKTTAYVQDQKKEKSTKKEGADFMNKFIAMEHLLFFVISVTIRSNF